MRLITNERGELMLFDDSGFEIDNIMSLKLNTIKTDTNSAVAVTCELYLDSIDVTLKSELAGEHVRISSYCNKCGQRLGLCSHEPKEPLQSTHVGCHRMSDDKAVGYIMDLAIEEDQMKPKLIMTRCVVDENNKPVFVNDEVMTEQEW